MGGGGGEGELPCPAGTQSKPGRERQFDEPTPPITVVRRPGQWSLPRPDQDSPGHHRADAPAGEDLHRRLAGEQDAREVRREGRLGQQVREDRGQGHPTFCCCCC